MSLIHGIFKNKTIKWIHISLYIAAHNLDLMAEFP